MGSKPKPQEYAPSATEKAQAAIAAEEQRYFENTYQPLFLKQLEKSANSRLAPTFRGRAQADTMETLTGGGPNISLVNAVDTAANLASGAVSNIAEGNVRASRASQKDQFNALGQSLGLGSSASSGLAAAARIDASRGLADAAAANKVRLARNNAKFGVVKAAAGMGMSNIASGGSFFKGRGVGVNDAGKLEGFDTNFFGQRIG